MLKLFQLHYIGSENVLPCKVSWTLNLALGGAEKDVENPDQKSYIIVEIQIRQSQIKAEVFLLESTCSVTDELNTEQKILVAL
jgi:hypothetical protein